MRMTSARKQTSPRVSTKAATHEDHCNVGELAGVTVTPERVAEKRWQREMVGKWARGELTREELYSSKPGG